MNHKHSHHDILYELRQGQTVFSGFLNSMLKKSTENRLRKVDYDHLVEPFRTGADADGKWRGEFWGKIVRSAIRTLHVRPDDELEGKIRASVATLLETQSPDGCISTYPTEKQTLGWDIWGRKYAMLGLARYYREIDSSEAVRDALERMLEHLMSQVGPGKKWIGDCGEHFGLAAVSILGAVLKVAAITGRREYDDYARWIVTSGKYPVLDDILKGHRPQNILSRKAYEMTSCVEGLVELYRAEGNELYLQAALNYYRQIRDTEITVTGGGGLEDVWGEYWSYGKKRQTEYEVGALGETCVATTWLRFGFSLLRLTGDPRIVDEMERTFYNAICGAVTPEGDRWIHRNPTPLAGASYKIPADEQIPGFSEDCCLAQGPEALATGGLFAVMSDAEGPVVNLYESGQVRVKLPGGGECELAISGDWPWMPDVRIRVVLDQPRRFQIRFRIPDWSTFTRVKITGRSYAATPGSYTAIEREWCDGDEVCLRFDFALRMEYAPSGCGRVALLRGPILLVQDSRLGAVDVPVKPESGLVSELPEAVNGVERVWTLGDGSRLCSYMEAGNEFSSENCLCVWLRRREKWL